jgi:hypothetical protein
MSNEGCELRIGSVLVALLLVFGFFPVIFAGAATLSKGHDYVATPFGMVPRGQVLEVPSGTVIVGGSTLLLPSGAQVVLPHHSSLNPPSQNGWIEYADWTYNQAGYSIGTYDAGWTLPSAPSNSNFGSSGGQVIYLFNGLEPSSTATSIIQPVLQWGNNGNFGGQYWDMASWYVYGSSYIYSTPMQVSYSSISGEMTGWSCQSSNGQCNWDIQGIQFQNGQGYTTTLSYSSHSQLKNLAMYWASVTLEAYGITQCSDFPSGSVTFSNLFFVSDVSPWQYPTPSWSTTVNYSNCGESVTVNSPSSVTLAF